MAHRDSDHYKVRFNFEYLKRSIDFLFCRAEWSCITWRADCTWRSPELLAIVALLWAWSNEQLITERFTTARRLALCMFPQTQRVAESYQGFLKLLAHWNNQLSSAVRDALQARMQSQLTERLRIGKFLMMAVDGSRIGLPRTRAHEQVFSVKRHQRGKRNRKRRSTSNEKKANGISMWITTLWHCGTGLPWNWRLGPSDSSERAHWMEMMKELKEETLFIADAGFAGYEYACAVLSAGHQILIRIGSNVTLINRLGYAREHNGIVYLWPKKAARADQPPLVLRLVRCHNGKHPIFLLTSVLSPTELSDQQIVTAYKRRWGIELYYRHLKQTYGIHKLKSRSPDAAYVEMTWAFLGLWCMGLYALKQLIGKGIEPKRLSFAKLIRAFRQIMRDYKHEAKSRKSLCQILREAVTDQYVRGDKTSHDYPRKKKEKPPGHPVIRNATKAETQLAKGIKRQNIEKIRLTA